MIEFYRNCTYKVENVNSHSSSRNSYDELGLHISVFKTHNRLTDLVVEVYRILWIRQIIRSCVNNMDLAKIIRDDEKVIFRDGPDEIHNWNLNT
jgi:hypothetical protein